MRFKSPYEDLLKQEKTRYRFEISIDIADKEIVDELERHYNKSEYVRQLIREDIKKRGN